MSGYLTTHHHTKAVARPDGDASPPGIQQLFAGEKYRQSL